MTRYYITFIINNTIKYVIYLNFVQNLIFIKEENIIIFILGCRDKITWVVIKISLLYIKFY